MGTRSLTCVFANGEYKVAQSGSWDGYPGGQGITVLEFLYQMDKEKFLEKLNQVRWITKEDLGTYWEESGASANDEWVSHEVGKKFGEKYPHLHKEMSADILYYIQETPGPILLKNDLDFAGSVLCEWAYVIDFDKNTFEIYEGLNTTPLQEGDRFYDLPQTLYAEEYYPVSIVASYSLDSLPSRGELESLGEE